MRMHADERDVDSDLVRALVAGPYPHWADLPIVAVPSAGTDNALFRLGEDMIVRVPRRPGADADIAKERRWLPVLAPALPVAVPAPLGGGDQPWPWSVYTWLPGANPVVGALADPAGLAADLGAFVAALHRVDPAGGPAAGRGVPLAHRDADTRAAIAALPGEVDVAAVTAAWEAALAVPVWTGPAVWLHADLAPGNLLCRDGRLVAVIDFGGLGVGDPAIDAMVGWNTLPPGDRATFRAAAGFDLDTWARGRGWALSVALIQLPYYRDTNPTLAASARHVIGEVLAETR